MSAFLNNRHFKTATTSRDGPGPFQGPSSYPSLLVVADCKVLNKSDNDLKATFLWFDKGKYETPEQVKWWKGIAKK
jgi:hypothetical protein